MKKSRGNLLITTQFCLVLLLTMRIAAPTPAQTPAARAKDHARQVTPSVVGAVHGSGTVGTISMWVDVRPNGDSTLGDSIIKQANGNIGIGLDAPASKLAVQGMIVTTLGGYKFPDGTIQTTAAVSGLQLVSHDATLQGNGTSGSPLGVSVPLVLTGSSARGFPAVIEATNTGEGGTGISGLGGAGNSSNGGIGVRAQGGNGLAHSANSSGGFGVFAQGGDAFSNAFGGTGIYAHGGIGGAGGTGLEAFGGIADVS